MNEDRIIQALTAYKGTEDSLKETVSVLAEELGPNWTETIFEQLGGLPVDLKEKLNHAFNYYGALMAWQETQSYLASEEPLDDSVRERLPILKHWLDFFGDPGIALYQELEKKLSVPLEPKPDETVGDSTGEDSHPSADSEEVPLAEETVSEAETENKENPEQEPVLESEPAEKEPSYDLNSPEAFTVQKAKKEIDLLDGVQAWLSARCLQLNNMEVFAYPYYGFAVDLMRQTVKDIQAVLDLEDKEIIGAVYEGGQEALERKKQAIESDIEMAVQNCESATTALIDENIDMDKVRKTLGDLDENPEPEYLGPAPDGFELLEDEDTPIDEKAVKEQYQRLEKEVLAENTEVEKKTSQNPQNSVQRKLNFSLKPKK